VRSSSASSTSESADDQGSGASEGGGPGAALGPGRQTGGSGLVGGLDGGPFGGPDGDFDGERLRRVAAHVFVEDLARPELGTTDFHHLARVLRLRPGEAVSAGDGRGSWRACEWQGLPQLRPTGEVVAGRSPPTPALTVAFALTKGARPEWTVQKLTELGVDRIVVMTSARSVARWEGGRGARQLERLRAVAREAAMQSRRLWLPEVEGPVPFASFVPGGLVPSGPSRFVAGGRAGPVPGKPVGPWPYGPAGHVASGPVELAGSYGVATQAGATGPVGRATAGGLALCDPSGTALTLATPTVLVGPEGGWSDEELAAVPEKVSLGPQVLRAETAAVAVGVILAALRSGLVCSPPA